MNFLTKLFLTRHHPHLQIGCFTGYTFLPEKSDGILKQFQDGIELGKQLDLFLKSHPIFKRCQLLIHPKLKRYSPELVMIFMDHWIAASWHQHSDINYTDFISNTHKKLEEYYHLYPFNTRKIYDAIFKRMAIKNYQSIHGFHELTKILGRQTRYLYLEHGIADLIKNYPEFNSQFKELFPELTAHSQLLIASDNKNTVSQNKMIVLH